MKKICKKRIFIIFSIILISFVTLNLFGSCVNAELNPEVQVDYTEFNTGLNNLLNKLAEGTVNSVFSGLASLLTILAAIIYFLVASIFSGVSGSLYPSPDNIVFNKIAILDVNFFNPNSASLIGMAKNGDKLIVAQLYNSFHTIALSIFIIAAMLVGIKMAISTIASDKAAAKKALINWIVGILILFLMRLIIAAIFELNEYFVWKISKATDELVFSIDTSVSIKDAIDFLGSPLTKIIKGTISIGTLIFNGGNSVIRLSGYAGMLGGFAYNAVCGDILAAILLFVLMGQTLTLFVAYGKRLMYAIILGVCAPLVVAIDTINKSTKGQSTILTNWFKEFTLIVFMQTFHAILMLVTLNILSSILVQYSKNPTFIGIAAIILTTGIVKFEKLYKQIFGISDGMLGGLQGSAGKVMAGIHGAKQGIQAIADNKGKLVKANTSKKVALSEKENAIKSYGKANFERSEVNLREAIKTMKNPEEREKFAGRALRDLDEAEKSGFGGREGEKEKMEQYRKFLNDVINGNYVPGQENQIINTGNHQQIYTAAQAADYLAGVKGNMLDSSVLTQSTDINTKNTTMNNKNNSTTNNSSGQSASVSTKELEQELSKLTREIANMNKKNDSIEESKRKIDDANRKVQQANSDYMSALVATATSPMNLAAGIGFGIGTGDDLSEAAFRGGYVTKGLDELAEKVGASVGRNMQAFDKHATVDNTN